MPLFKDYRPAFDDPLWVAARDRLKASDTVIAQIDTGVFAHPSLGFDPATGAPPTNIQVHRGRNFFDPGGPFGDDPITDLRKGNDAVSQLIDYPDHGIKTMSVILSDSADFTGVAPGAKIVPYRISNGPLFKRTQMELADRLDATARIGQAIENVLGLNPRPQVITLSMGNPAFQPWELFRLFLGGNMGVAKSTAKAVDRAYLRGVPLICAAGQVVRATILPAMMKRTIAVGGFGFRDDATTPVHYPRGGYTNPSRVDTWALASDINRAGGHRDGGQIIATHAEGEDAGEPSGTSYATPFVAAGYAMWFETHKSDLLSPDFSGRNAWKRIESFRHILRTVMPTEDIASGHGTPPTVPVRRLDMVKLLQTAPLPDGLEFQPPYRTLYINNTDQASDYDPLIG